MLTQVQIDYSIPETLAGSAAAGSSPDTGPVQRLYSSLLSDCIDADTKEAARVFLRERLDEAASTDCDLPEDVHGLPEWLSRNTEAVGEEYRIYLEQRKAGAPRRYFATRSHALYFLKGVAPTKLVDGSWLYGVTGRWNDERFRPLIRTYLEELGEGMADKNHVVLYRKLLATHGCDQWGNLDEAHFTQGAIQLALGQQAEEFLPEVIGFNLGYEQLPLHLLITAYELNELGIDPYYFTLHVTVDNAVTGHARKSVQGVLDALPKVGDADEFYRRIRAGYRLNNLGASTNSVIAEFDLDRELLSVFAAKATVGSMVHSDYCRVAGRTVNDWLSQPGQLPAFLQALEKVGWIRRHQDPEESRFWKLIHGERAEMFGVFNEYEQQLIHDWILGDGVSASGKPRQLTFKAQQRLADAVGQGAARQAPSMAPRGVLRTNPGRPSLAQTEENHDFNADLRLLEEKLAALPSREEVMATLTGLISPASHHTAAGMMATRIYTRLFG